MSGDGDDYVAIIQKRKADVLAFVNNPPPASPPPATQSQQTQQAASEPLSSIVSRDATS